MLIKNLIINELHPWMDGGTITMKCSSDDHQYCTIEVQQHMMLKTSSDGKMPGRLYFNNRLVEERSEIEATILQLLEQALTEAQSSIDRHEKALIQEKIDYIRSEEYLKNNKKIADQRLPIEGREFDWLVMDRKGRYALFSSAGHGTIPMNVIEDYKSHDAITAQFSLSNIGTETIWEDFASYGLYVYDWDINKDGPYIRKSKPSSAMPEEISKRLSSLRSLVKLEISFEEALEVIIKEGMVFSDIDH